VLGTLMLGILAGSKRYAHIAGVRGDAVAAKALGLGGMVSEDSVRRAQSDGARGQRAVDARGADE
jgi:cytochrome c-type biogenesis protein CcmE